MTIGEGGTLPPVFPDQQELEQEQGRQGAAEPFQQEKEDMDTTKELGQNNVEGIR